MTLKDNFFRVIEVTKTDTTLDYLIAFNPEHFIYQAHFPGNPTTPGVCIIQTVKELAEMALQSKLFLKKIHNVKFLNVINPIENKVVTFSISIVSEEGNTHKVAATVSHNSTHFVKLSMSFISE